MIVPLREEHILPCAQIMAGNHLWKHYCVTLSSAETLFDEGFNAQDAQIYVSLNDDTVRGFIWYYLQGTFHNGGYIRLLGVHTDYQGQGIGAQLLQSAEKNIVTHTPHLFLLASDFNHRAHQFYNRLGYDIIGECPNFAQGGTSEMIFYKRLTAEKGKPTPTKH
ncbi:MAG: GNAT family N-acetyltransferase [Chloroflexota bacterium]